MDSIYIIYSNTGFESKFVHFGCNQYTYMYFFHPENGSIFVELNL